MVGSLAEDARLVVSQLSPHLRQGEVEYEAAVQEIAEVLAKWQTNQHAQSDGSTALYHICPILPHSCAPNVCYSPPDARGQVDCMALQKIRKGDMLTVSYMEEAFLAQGVRRRRQVLLKERFFSCLCDRCEAESLLPHGGTPSPQEPLPLEAHRETASEEQPEEPEDEEREEENAPSMVEDGPAWKALLARNRELEALLSASQAEAVASKRALEKAEAKADRLEAALRQLQGATLEAQASLANAAAAELGRLRVLVDVGLLDNGSSGGMGDGGGLDALD